MNGEQTHSDSKRFNFWSRAFICSALLIVGYFLLTEHRAHVFAAIPWILILACPLMHLFMGHGSHGSHNSNRREDNQGRFDSGSSSEHKHG